MAGQSNELSGPDFEQGVESSKVPENRMLLGHYRGDAVIVTRVNGRCSSVGATCTHYGAPLIDGILVDGTIRCPWHHACFSVDGDNLRPPALDGLARYSVEEKGGRVRVIGKVFSVLSVGMVGANM